MNNESDKDITLFPIKIDKEGVWFYKGAKMFREDILSLFFESLRKDKDGKHYVEMSGKRNYIEVEDTPFVVKAVYKSGDSSQDSEVIDILLTDKSVEKLDVRSLRMQQDNILYCTVKEGTFDARFSRAGYYQIAEFIDHDESSNEFAIVLNKERYPIKIENSQST